MKALINDSGRCEESFIPYLSMCTFECVAYLCQKKNIMPFRGKYEGNCRGVGGGSHGIYPVFSPFSTP